MINCKKYADEILDSVTGRGHLAVISVGDDPASLSYVKGKQKDCERVGFNFTHFALSSGTAQEEIVKYIDVLNDDPDVTGIIVQLPLPEHLNADEIVNHIVPYKDVDGFTKDSPYKPCTPEGIIYIMRKELGELKGKHAVIIGRGRLVGKPLAEMLLEEDMTVTVCHSKTPRWLINTLAYSRGTDAIIVATGRAKEFSFTKLNLDTLVIDCGVHRDEQGKLCGDVMVTNTDKRTPVPGGVGLLTRAMLIKHTEAKQ